MVNFKVTDDELTAIRDIAERAEKEVFGPYGIKQTQTDTQMDLCAVIAQGCPLRLDELFFADPFNFAHDIGGIWRHLDRRTGKLGGFFVPRFARGQ